ncbi:MAG: N-acetyltransferase [Kiritimatiellae bacterium]|nr:N-acetyltransferase [Kiritimatiellia bacterium]
MEYPQDGFWLHPDALVDAECIGKGTRIYAFSHVMAGVTIGEQCNLGEHVYVETGAVIGNRVTVKNGVQVWEGITLEDDVFVGPGVVFLNDRYPRSRFSVGAGDRYQTKGWLEPTVVREGAAIGGNATILCGLEIGRYATVGAGAVVTRSVAPHTLVLGAPALVHSLICACGKPFAGDGREYACPHCGRAYAVEAGVPRPLHAT